MNQKVGSIQSKDHILNKLFFFENLKNLLEHCFICRPSDSAVPEDAGIKPKTVRLCMALAVRRYNHCVRSHPQLGWISSLSDKLYLARLNLIPVGQISISGGQISSHSAGSHLCRLDLIPLQISSLSDKLHLARPDLIPVVQILSPTWLDLLPFGQISIQLG